MSDQYNGFSEAEVTRFRALFDLDSGEPGLMRGKYAGEDASFIIVTDGANVYPIAMMLREQDADLITDPDGVAPQKNADYAGEDVDLGALLSAILGGAAIDESATSAADSLWGSEDDIFASDEDDEEVNDYADEADDDDEVDVASDDDVEQLLEALFGIGGADEGFEALGGGEDEDEDEDEDDWIDPQAAQFSGADEVTPEQMDEFVGELAHLLGLDGEPADAEPQYANY